MENSLQTHRNSLANRIALSSLAAILGAAPVLGQSGVHPSFTMENIRPSGWDWAIGAFDFMSDGTMAVASWKDPYEIHLVKNATGPKGGMTVSKFATGLRETLGLKVLNDSIYILQKDELTLLLDHDGDGMADEYRALAYDWTKTPNEKEYARGLVWDGQYFYGVFDGTTINGGTAVNPNPPGRQNGVLKWTKTGEQTIVCGGMRVPIGIGLGPEKSIWVTDNQGGYRVSNPLIHIKQDAWYGRPVNPKSVFQPIEYTKTPNPDDYEPFAVRLEYDKMASSPGNVVMVPAELEPYAGQLLVTDASDKVGGVQRVFVEKIGEDWQGAVFPFSKGFEEPAILHIEWGPDGKLYAGANGSHGKGWGRKTWIGLDRMAYKGNETFEMLAIRNLGQTSFEIEFTHPLANTPGQDLAGSLSISSWTEQISESYGGPKKDVHSISVSSAVVSEDKTKVLVSASGSLKLRYDYYFEWGGGLKSADGKSLYSNKAWYTLNRYGPGRDPDLTVTSTRPSKLPVHEWAVHPASEGMLRVTVIPRGDDPYVVRVLSVDGKTLAKRSGRGSGDLVFEQSRLTRGLLVVRLETPHGAETRTVFNGGRVHSGRIR